MTMLRALGISRGSRCPLANTGTLWNNQCSHKTIPCRIYRTVPYRAVVPCRTVPCRTVTVNVSLHVEPTWAYRAQFQWHDGEGRLRLDPVSTRTGDGSHRCSISHPFAYHSLPYILQPFFRECHTYRRDGHIVPTTGTSFSGTKSPLAPNALPCVIPYLRDMHKVIQAQFLGVQFDGTGDWRPIWSPDNPLQQLSPPR